MLLRVTSGITEHSTWFSYLSGEVSSSCFIWYAMVVNYSKIQKIAWRVNKYWCMLESTWLQMKLIFVMYVFKYSPLELPHLGVMYTVHTLSLRCSSINYPAWFIVKYIRHHQISVKILYPQNFLLSFPSPSLAALIHFLACPLLRTHWLVNFSAS